MENNLRIRDYVLNKFNENNFNIRVWRDQFNYYMIVVGFYCFCNQKFDMRTRNLILSESANGSMMEKANELTNIYLKGIQYV